MIRKHIYYSGQVQGVGFRYTAERAARGYEVRGYVRNMRDGRVEVLVEGEHGEVEAFVTDLAGQMRGYIRDVDVQEEAYEGDFVRFEIRF